jgi:hypothetical protein
VFGRAICGYYLFTGLAWGRWHPLIVISPHLARLLARQGWNKDAVRRYLYDEARIPAREVENRGKYVNLDVADQVRRGMIPGIFAESNDPARLIPTFIKPEWISIVVAGNPESFWQRGYMNNHAQGAPVTRVVKPVTGVAE